MDEELQLRLLGNLEIRRSGSLVAGFISNKAQALLCYLAVTGRPHLRPALAGLLWGELPEASALNGLRQALANLRHLVGPHVSITREDVALNLGLPFQLDVKAFEARVAGAYAQDTQAGSGIKGLEEAVALYRGDFLEGFYVHHAPAFEEWALAQRARLHELAVQALHALAAYHAQRGQPGRAAAIDYTTRLLALEPWREEAHRQLMLLLAAGGQRSAALAQYETCRRLLGEELAVEAGLETISLYEQIRDGTLPAEPPGLDVPPAPLPGFVTGRATAGTRTVFVARERELGWLDARLVAALDGHGQAAFVVGGPGRGKTVLLHEFARRALDAHPELLLAMGTCNAYSGVGDPYLPFRGVLAMLTGDAEPPWAAGTLDAHQARRMWDAVPEAAAVIARRGSGLVGTLLPGRELLARGRAAAPAGADWLPPLERLADPRTNPPGGLEQSHLFEQFANVLLDLSQAHPLLLVLDDLQWADLASIGLLFYLGRRIERGRILLAGAYRPHELALGRDGDRHPLEPALAEFRARFGDAWLDLAAVDETEGRLFVDRFLDSEPNALDEEFRRALFGRTRGHPLFTVELLRAMQQRGDLVRDQAGRWTQGKSLDWDALPVRAQAAIAERVARLPEDLRQVLAVAAAEGEEFTAQAVALVLGLDELHTLRLLREQLAARHRLLREQGELRLDGRSLSRYRFSHFLLQQHLYQELGEGERRLLHRRVGEALEQLYQERLEDAAVQLVRHFAGDPERERRYVAMAARRALAQYANEEAVGYLNRALDLAPSDDLRERYELLSAREKVHDLLGQRDAHRQDVAELEVLAVRLGTGEQAELRLRLGQVRWQAAAYAEAGVQFEAALGLARASGDRHLEGRALGGLARVRWAQGDSSDAERLSRESLVLAQQAGDATTQAKNAHLLGAMALYQRGRRDEARNWLEAGRALSEEIGDRQELVNTLRMLGHLAREQGDWEKAKRYYGDSLALAEEIGDRRASAHALFAFAMLAYVRGEFAEARTYFERSKPIAEEIGASGLSMDVLQLLGWSACQEGAYDEAQTYHEEAIGLARQIGLPAGIACAQARLGYVLVLQGRRDEGWALLVQELCNSLASELSAQALPEILQIVGQMGVHLGQFQRAAELLGLGFRIDPWRPESEEQLRPELDMLRAALGAEDLEAALARGGALDLRQAVAEMLVCNTPEAYWGRDWKRLRPGATGPDRD